MICLGGVIFEICNIEKYGKSNGFNSQQGI